MNRTLRVYAKKVGQAPEVTMMDTSLESIHDFLGGYMQVVNLAEGIGLVINEEGLLQDLEPNFELGGQVIVGDVFFVGLGMVEGEIDFLDLSDRQLEIIIENVVWQTPKNKPKFEQEFHEIHDIKSFLEGLRDRS